MSAKNALKKEKTEIWPLLMLHFSFFCDKIPLNMNLKVRELAMKAKRVICLILVISIVVGFLGMMGAWLASL